MKKRIVRKEDRTLEVVTHVLGIFSSIIGALLVFLMTKDKEVKKHARIALNWQISFLVYSFLLLLLSAISYFLTQIYPDVWIIFPFSTAFSVLNIVNLVFCIIAAFKAYDGVLWKYPLSIDFIARINEKNVESGKREVKRAYKKVKKEFKK